MISILQEFIIELMVFKKRIIETELKRRLGIYPSTLLVGSRQVGKTTLAKGLSRAYYDLQSDQDWIRLNFEWDDLVISGKQLIVLDEAQERPEVFKRLRSEIAIKTENRVANFYYWVLFRRV